MDNLVLLCRAIATEDSKSQRELSEGLDISSGTTSKLIKKAVTDGLIISNHERFTITEAGLKWLQSYRVDNAIVLAAGSGTRFVPLTYDAPKGLLKVKGVPMINRQIEQLLEVGITEIVVVVGYLAEMFEYLIDEYGVKLVYNPEYATKNNYASLYHAREHLKSTYILVADNWIENNVFYAFEPDTWISCIYHEGETIDWGVTVDAHDRIVRMDFGAKDNWVMVGPAYFSREFSTKYLTLLEEYYTRPGTTDYYWEHIIKENIRELPVHIMRQSATNVYEFESIDDLCAYDPGSLLGSENETLGVISEVFSIPFTKITGIRPMNEGMTNRSFCFEIEGSYYVYRQPGVGTEMLINRSNEKRSYELAQPLDITDEVYYFDGDSGVKITRYYNARVTDPYNDDEVKLVMELLRRIHGASIQAEYRFDIGERISYYESLANERDSILFDDYAQVREYADELLTFRDSLSVPEQFCHIDYVFTNVLFTPEDGIRVIDWEYAGMADPLIDVAMFSIYAYYDKGQIDTALHHYLGRKPKREEVGRLYLYVALAGFLWSIWTEYKQGLGDEFGDYGIRMYRYMKDYYRLLKKDGYLG